MKNLTSIRTIVFFLALLFLTNCNNTEIVVVVKNIDTGKIFIDSKPIDNFVKSRTGQSATDSTYYLTLNPGKYNVKIENLNNVTVFDTTIYISSGAYYGIDLKDQTLINL